MSAAGPDPVLVLFGERIRTERLSRNWSQLGLSRKAGLRPDAVRKYEKATNEPGVLSALAIAGTLGLSLDEMLSPPSSRCAACRNRPPAGYRCIACGRERAR